MKKVIFFTGFWIEFRWALAWASMKFGECICCLVYTCFAFCLFMTLFFGDRTLERRKPTVVAKRYLAWRKKRCEEKVNNITVISLDVFFTSESTTILQTTKFKTNNTAIVKWNHTKTCCHNLHCKRHRTLCSSHHDINWWKCLFHLAIELILFPTTNSFITTIHHHCTSSQLPALFSPQSNHFQQLEKHPPEICGHTKKKKH